MWIDTILQGVLLGGLYALFATGLSLSFGIMRLVNIAHGDFIVLAAYGGVVAVNWIGVPLYGSIVVVVPLMATLGYALQRLVLNHTLGQGILPPLLVTFGISVIIQNVLLTVFSADSQGLNTGAFQTTSLDLGGGIALGWFPLLVFATAVGVIVGLQLLSSHTALGRAFRATSDDPRIAQLMGVDHHHAYALAMALTMAVVAIAGIYLAMRTTVTPTIGPIRLLLAFEAVIIGGMGSLWGTLVGGIILGVAQSIGNHINPGFGLLAGHLAFLIMLMLRPAGLFPKTLDA
jgi:branched-chain amino acid transport system permease protein